MPPSLPPFSWTAHSEQIDAASLHARIWQMRTTLLNGRVFTALLSRPPDDVIMMLEAIARRHEEHRKTCKDSLCVSNAMHLATICPGGKYNPSICVFLTLVLDDLSRPIHDLCVVATDPATAIKNHYDACTVVAGVLGSWSVTEEQRA